jgi:hypothetical protein
VDVSDEWSRGGMGKTHELTGGRERERTSVWECVCVCLSVCLYRIIPTGVCRPSSVAGESAQVG